jgi:hypothetical protein
MTGHTYRTFCIIHALAKGPTELNESADVEVVDRCWLCPQSTEQFLTIAQVSAILLLRKLRSLLHESYKSLPLRKSNLLPHKKQTKATPSSGFPSNATLVQTSVALDGNPEPNLVHATGCKQPTLRLLNNACKRPWRPIGL